MLISAVVRIPIRSTSTAPARINLYWFTMDSIYDVLCKVKLVLVVASVTIGSLVTKCLITGQIKDLVVIL